MNKITDRSEVDKMASIMAAFEGNTGSIRKSEASATGMIGPEIDEQAGVDAMKNILSIYCGGMEDTVFSNKIETVTRNLMKESEVDSTLRTSMITEEIDDGSQIGNWQIFMKKDGKRRLYDVVGQKNGQTIAADLTLYEAAYGIAKALSNGDPITSKTIRNILQFEGDYARSLHDAIHFRHGLSKTGDKVRRAVLEDRYDFAKERARLAKEKLENLVRPFF